MLCNRCETFGRANDNANDNDHGEKCGRPKCRDEHLSWH